MFASFQFSGKRKKGRAGSERITWIEPGGVAGDHFAAGTVENRGGGDAVRRWRW